MSKGQTGRDTAGYKRGVGPYAKDDALSRERQSYPEGFSRGNQRPSRSDEVGYEKGCSQGYSKCFDDRDYTGADYNKKWLTHKDGPPVGQTASVGSGSKMKQRGY